MQTCFQFDIHTTTIYQKLNLRQKIEFPYMFYTWEHARLYPNVAFYGKQSLAILGSYIEIERIFSMAIVLTIHVVVNLGSQTWTSLS